MFGYVRPSDDRLTPADRETFRAAYCGLCHALGARYGLVGRMILNYDLTFLAMVLSDGAGEMCAKRCAVHPMRRRCCVAGDPALDAAADMSVILTYWQLRDGVADHGFWGGLKYRIASVLLRPAYRRARERRPRFDAGTQAHLAELAALDLRMAALGVKWDEAVQRAKEWQKQLEELEKQLRDLETDEGVAKLADQVSAGTLTMTDAVTQIISANIQLDSALSQIDQGLQTLEESRSAALSQADLSSSLSLPTITALLTAQNFSMPAGYLKEDGVNYMVSVGDAIDTRQDLEDLVLFDLGMDGIDPIRMKDVADVAITDNSSEIYDKLNGKDGVIVSLNKQSTYATAEVSVIFAISV